MNCSPRNKCKWIKWLISFIVACIGIYVAYSQLSSLTTELQTSNFIRMSNSYRSISAKFQKVFNGKEDNITEKHHVARSYFNLWADEYLLCKTGGLPHTYMNHINYGACLNMKIYPQLKESYKYWKEKNAFKHTPELEKYIEKIINKSEEEFCNIDTSTSCIPD